VGHSDKSGGKLAALDAEASAALLQASADVALVLDASGVIRSVSVGSEDWPREDQPHWVGQPWAQVVTSESRPKIEEMLLTPCRVSPRLAGATSIRLTHLAATFRFSFL